VKTTKQKGTINAIHKRAILGISKRKELFFKTNKKFLKKKKSRIIMNARLLAFNKNGIPVSHNFAIEKDILFVPKIA